MKRALITGASGVIGAQIATTLHLAGYKVVLQGRNIEKLQALSEKLGGAKFYALDLLGDFSPLKQEKIDILINNAGAYVYSPVEQDFDPMQLLKLNCAVPYQLVAAFVPHMKAQNWGRIVNIGSISGVVGEAGAALYSMTKSALIGLTRSLALELAPFGICTNLINPGWVKSDLAQDSISAGDFTQAEILETIPQRRFVEPFEVAEMVKFMVSEPALGLTGQSISLCAGLSVGA